MQREKAATSLEKEMRYGAFDEGRLEEEGVPIERKRERLPSDYDETELDLIAKREQADKDRRAMLREKQQEEMRKKAERQSQGETELIAWADNRKKEILQRRKQNQEEEKAFVEARKLQNNGKNPWEKVLTNVEIKEGQYPGNKDVSRMRQVMISRRNDIKQGFVQLS